MKKLFGVLSIVALFLAVCSTAAHASVSGSALTVTAAVAPTNPAAGSLLMGSTQVPMAASNLTETMDQEPVYIGSIMAFQYTNGSPSDVTNVTLYQDGEPVAVAGSPQASVSGGWLWPFNFPSGLGIGKGKTITLVLKADVQTYASGATDRVASTFQLVTTADSSNLSPEQTVFATGSHDHQVTTITLAGASGNQQLILRNVLSVQAQALGLTTGRSKTSVDPMTNLLLFAAGAPEGLVVNSVTLTVNGTLPASTFSAANGDIWLYDPQTGLVAATASSTPCSSGGTCTVTFSFGSGYILLPGNFKSFQVRINSLTDVTSGSPGVALTFSLSIPSAPAVTFTDATDGTGVTVTGAESINLPLTMNAVSYATGT